MMLRGISHWLCALALLIAQCSAVVHATQHEFTGDGSEVGCDVCALAHASAPPPVLVDLFKLIVLRQIEIAPPDFQAPFLRSTSRPRSRAPPPLL